MDTRFSTHKGFLIQRSYLQEGIRTGCPDAPSDGFVSHGEREEYKSVGLLPGIKELPGGSLSSSCEDIYYTASGVSVGALSPYERLSETMVGDAAVRDRGKVTRCGPWLLVVIACKTCFTLIDHPDDLYPDGSCRLSGCVVETIRMSTLCQRRLLFLGQEKLKRRLPFLSLRRSG
uniref:Uncharacterized protein n=1 Tax=Vitis vinifera TaxID=29760 RepID=A5B1Q8_VITVI|nr:hypothetical protein VITISV_000248 [Vitis vinifera]